MRPISRFADHPGIDLNFPHLVAEYPYVIVWELNNNIPVIEYSVQEREILLGVTQLRRQKYLTLFILYTPHLAAGGRSGNLGLK